MTLIANKIIKPQLNYISDGDTINSDQWPVTSIVSFQW